MIRKKSKLIGLVVRFLPGVMYPFQFNSFLQKTTVFCNATLWVCPKCDPKNVNYCFAPNCKKKHWVADVCKKKVSNFLGPAWYAWQSLQKASSALFRQQDDGDIHLRSQPPDLRRHPHERHPAADHVPNECLWQPRVSPESPANLEWIFGYVDK